MARKDGIKGERQVTHPRRLDRQKRALRLVEARIALWAEPCPLGVTTAAAARKLHTAQNEHDTLRNKIGGR